MAKRNKIIYWVATVWLALGMVSTGIVQLLQIEEESKSFERLGYPAYLMVLLGVLKILGIISLLIPKFTLLKEWAYSGFFFMMIGAIYSHIAVNDPAGELFGPLLLVVLTLVSWYFRPPGRRISKQISNSKI
jgi:uncharacterized membrane protein YphA (DoxX/SURF4 family)